MYHKTVRNDILGDMRLNTSLKKPLADTSTKQSSHAITPLQVPNDTEENATPSQKVEWKHLYDIITTKLKDYEKYIEINDAFIQLYRSLIWRHQIKKLKELPRKHLSWIIELLELNKQTQAGNQILILYNETNILKAESLEDILLSDFSPSNHNYLSTLKILTLQLILKTKTTERYVDTILEFFSHDARYILKDEQLKSHTLTKLVLNFFSLLPDYKALFGLKFLQYVSQFQLEFKQYIKNLDLVSFQKQIIRILRKASNDNCMVYLPSFYNEYMKHTVHEKINLKEFLYSKSSEHSIMSFTSHLKDGVLKTHDILQYLHSLSHKASIDKIAANICDKIVINLNKSIKKTEDSDITEISKLLSSIFFNANDNKRYDNVTSVLFNCFVIKRNSNFLSLAAKLVYKSLTKSPHDNAVFEKFEKFIGSCNSKDLQKVIFSYCCNIFTFYDEDSFENLWVVTRKKVLRCFKRLKVNQFEIFDYTSEPILCLLYSGTMFSEKFAWSPLCYMLNSILINKVDKSINIDAKVQQLDSLSSYEILIKSIYCLNIEIDRGTSLKLQKICNLYLKRWVESLPTGETVSHLEKILLETLVQYLHQHHMHKLSLDICLSVKDLPYYNDLKEDVNLWLLDCYIGLEIVPNIENIISSYHSSVSNTESEILEMPFDRLLPYLHTMLKIVSWRKDSKTFNGFMISQLKEKRPEFFDIQNSTKLPISSYLKVLLFNIKLALCASQLQYCNNNIYDSLKECKRALKLCKLLINKESVLSSQRRSEVICLLELSFQTIIKIYIRVGLFKDCSFYIKEYENVLGSLSAPTALFNMFACFHQFYILVEDEEGRHSTLQKLNKLFDLIDGSINIKALAEFLYINKEYQKLEESMKLFFGANYEKTSIVTYWMLMTGNPVEETFGRNDFASMNYMNKSKELYTRVRKQMETDSFFRSMGESVMAIPCCYQSGNPSKVARLITSKNLSYISSQESPRSSSLTPRGKALRKNFDSSSAINNLQMINKLVDAIDIDSLKNYELKELAALHALSLSLLSNMIILSKEADDLNNHFKLRDIPRSLSLYYEKLFSNMGVEIYDNFIPGSIKSVNPQVAKFKTDFIEVHSNFAEKWSKFSFNVISIDICQLTGDLLITRFDTNRKKDLHLRLPLNRHHSRDLSEEVFDFDSALSELNSIITANNKSTSTEVTSSINSKEQRKKWWDDRYILDRRLERILNKVEDSWLCGFKGVFNPSIVQPENFEKFKKGFQSILHNYLPSRKLTGQTNSFLQIEDSLIELFLFLDILNQPTDKAVSLMEDLIYFIFDILLFHGEQNAYDEIDINLIHVKFEELLQDYSNCTADNTLTVDHTFLILGNKCHMFPWESLSFLKNISVSRVASLSSLDELLAKHGDLFPEIDISSNLSVVLNPGNDLNRSEITFGNEFKSLCKTSESKLFIGNAPSVNEFYDCVTQSRLFVYIGHSGGEQYVKLKDLKKCSRIAPSFLLGCSSASLKYSGNFESTGTVLAYLLGGSPMVVGNLWDVTDKDTDKLSYSIFELTGLFGNPSSAVNISQAICSSREQCKMRYLNGAAMVVYGLPMRFSYEH